MRRGLVVLVVLVAASVFASGAYAAGNSDAAHACQQGGYLTLHRSDGSSFTNSGDCVSYFAQGATSGCIVTATTGCLTFDNVTLGDGYGDTVTVNAAYSFNTTCNDFPGAPIACPTDPRNDYATGGGTYVIRYASGAVEQGTLVTADTAGAQYEGLADGYYTEADGFTATTCSAAAVRQVEVYSSTGVASDPYVKIGAFTDTSDPAIDGAGVLTIDRFEFSVSGPLTGVTLAC